MPSQPAWFHRLEEILSAPRSMTSTHLDRLAPSDDGARCGGVAGGGSSRNHHAWARRAADRI